MIEQIKFERFTAFEDLTIPFSKGINIFIGENGTGKTHILKAIYSACDVSKTQKSLAEKVARVFLPSEEQIGRLVKRKKASTTGSFEVVRSTDAKQRSLSIKLSLSNHTKDALKAKVLGTLKLWQDLPIEAAYIPVKDMMANAPGFRSLYNLRNIHFEEVYADILDRAFLGSLKGQPDQARKNLLTILQRSMDGKVIFKNEEFFLKNKQGELEFTLLAEGIRKLGLLWVLIQNGTLLNGSVLLWDEPETNLNPKLIRTVVEILIALQRIGVQIFLSTHNYSILKEFDLQTGDTDEIFYVSLFRDESGDVKFSRTNNYLDLAPNSIDETYGSFIDREITKSLGNLGK
jgi:AAA15 family ATPase/GTPase